MGTNQWWEKTLNLRWKEASCGYLQEKKPRYREGGVSGRKASNFSITAKGEAENMGTAAMCVWKCCLWFSLRNMSHGQWSRTRAMGFWKQETKQIKEVIGQEHAQRLTASAGDRLVSRGGITMDLLRHIQILKGRRQEDDKVGLVLDLRMWLRGGWELP